MASRRDSVNGIEIKKEHICIAQYSPSARTVLNASLVLAPVDEAENGVAALKPAVKKLIARLQAEGQNTIASVPSDFAVVKKVMIDRSEADVREAVQWELSQQIIGTLDDYAWDFTPVADDGGDVRRYVAVAYKNDGVQKIVGLLKASKLVAVAVDLDMFALVNVFEVNYPDLSPTPSIIVHGREEVSTVIVTKNGEFTDCEVAFHQSGLSSPDSYAELLRETIARSFPQASSFPLFCTGSPFSQQDFAEGVFARLGNAQMLNPFAVVESRIEIEEADLQKCIPYLSVAVGLAIRGDE